MNIAERIAAAFKNTSPEYLTQCLEQRNPGPDAKGSFFDETQTVESLVAASWEEYSHPNILSPAIGFRAKLPGTVGIVDLATLHASTPVVLNGKETDPDLDITGSVKLAKEDLPKSEYTTLLIEPDNGKEVVSTFFPGDPTPFSRIKDRKLIGKQMNVALALQMGIRYGKIS
jgi:hypothetical protein